MRFSIDSPESIVEPSQLGITSELLSNSQEIARSISVCHGSLPISKFEIRFLEWARNFPIQSF